MDPLRMGRMSWFSKTDRTYDEATPNAFLMAKISEGT